MSISWPSWGLHGCPGQSRKAQVWEAQSHPYGMCRTSLLDPRSVPTCEEDGALERMQPKLTRTKDLEKKRSHPQTTQNSGYRTPRQGFIHLQHPEHLALFSKPAADLLSTLGSSSFFFKKILT